MLLKHQTRIRFIISLSRLLTPFTRFWFNLLYFGILSTYTSSTFVSLLSPTVGTQLSNRDIFFILRSLWRSRERAFPCFSVRVWMLLSAFPRALVFQREFFSFALSMYPCLSILSSLAAWMYRVIIGSLRV